MINLYLHALGRLLVPDCRQSGAHLQRLHTERLLWVNRPVPRQAFTVRKTYMGERYIRGLENVFAPLRVLHF